MVVLNKIYTKAGDDGTTALGTGERRKKYDPRIAAYGTVDEVNAALGVARLYVEDTELDAILGRVQNDLFDLGADLCTLYKGKSEGGDALRVSATQVARLETEIDRLNAHLASLRSFVLPGGTPAAAHLHVARTQCRRAERRVVALADQPEEADRVSPHVISYLNRLSDLLFVAARHANQQGERDVLWQPGENR